MPQKADDKQSNVIAFARGPRPSFRCADATDAAICSYCGGLLMEGESEDDCSSVVALAFIDRLRPRKPAAL